MAPVFEPLGFGNWQSTVATVMGLVAKEEVVGVFGVLYGVTDEEGEDAAMGIVEDEGMSNEEKSAALSPIAQSFDESSGGHGQLAAFAFLIFNLLCAPCFAAMGAIKREMNNGKWTAFAIGYQCLFAYAVALTVYQFGLLFAGAGFGVGTAVAILLVAFFLYMLLRKKPLRRQPPDPEGQNWRVRTFREVYTMATWIVGGALAVLVARSSSRWCATGAMARADAAATAAAAAGAADAATNRPSDGLRGGGVSPAPLSEWSEHPCD